MKIYISYTDRYCINSKRHSYSVLSNAEIFLQFIIRLKSDSREKRLHGRTIRIEKFSDLKFPL